MFVSGFTFIRNAIEYDYPIVEAIQSILPICDEVVVAVGNSEDETLELIRSIASDKIKIIETTWDDSLREGGQVLAEETNKALDGIQSKADWAFYIQGDEVMHENYLPALKSAMNKWKDHDKVEGLLFDYLHFYGSYDFVADAPSWYRREIRIIRPGIGIRSYRDAQGFRKKNQKLKVKPVEATMHHYGWVKHPGLQQKKQASFNKLWHSDDWVEEKVGKVETFDYSNIQSLKRFKGTHPEVMRERIKKMNWEFSFDPTQKKLKTKSKIKLAIEKATGWRPGEYKNYKII